LNGHGTHVSGTIGGVKYGVAKNVTLIAVKVLDGDGSGSYSGVIKGINWVVESFKKRKRPSVANMSLGGPYSQAVNDAVSAAVEAGVVFGVAAGNEDSDACDGSPASTVNAITVGATAVSHKNDDQLDIRSTFSNWGTCVDIFAPGTLITSSWIGGTSATKTISGTSMATPHVVGAAARYLSENKMATPKEVKQHLVETAGSDMIDLSCAGRSSACKKSPNKMLYASCEDEQY
jgi:subtilisin family serine protease